MKMKTKQYLSLLVILCIFFSLFHVFESSTLAAAVYPNKYTYIRNAPYWFVSVIDQFSTSQAVTPLEREGDYIYVEYTKNNVKKRGYMPLADLSNVSIPWCNHTEFNPGKIKSTSSVQMFYGPNKDTYGIVTTLSSTVGSTSNNPLLILGYSGIYAQVQYVSNYTQTAYNVQPQYCRGWVLTSQIEAIRPNASSYLGTSVITMIKNISTNKYLTVVETSSTETGYRVILSESTGRMNQHWRINRYTYSSNGVYYYYYKIVSVSTGLCLQVQDALPMSYNLIELEVPGDPDKSQEFEMCEISDSSYNNVIVGKKYNIKTRMTGSYQSLDVSDENTVQLRTNGNSSQVWSVERFDKYWNNIYTNLPKNGNTFNLKYYINEENSAENISNVNITNTDVESSINKWNIRDSNQNLYVNISKTNNKNEAKVIVQAKDLGSAATARCMPAILYNGVETQGTNYINQEWQTSYVQLNSNSGFSGSFARILLNHVKKGVICHEFGHALKLKHPYGELNSGLDQVVYSVMNQGVYAPADGAASYFKVEYEPTIYDKQNLLNKWSGS